MSEVRSIGKIEKDTETAIKAVELLSKITSESFVCDEDDMDNFLKFCKKMYNFINNPEDSSNLSEKVSEAIEAKLSEIIDKRK